jgi:hypothetical protein
MIVSSEVAAKRRSRAGPDEKSAENPAFWAYAETGTPTEHFVLACENKECTKWRLSAAQFRWERGERYGITEANP